MSTWGRTLGGFAISRISRLYPAHWTAVAFTAGVLWLLRGVTYSNCVLFCGLWTAAGVIAPTAGSGLLDFFAVPQFAPYFVAGIAFHLMRRFRPTLLLWVIVVLQFLLAQTYVAARLDANVDHDAHVWPARLVITLAFAAMAAIALGALDRVQWRRLRTAGAITYPLYLIHMVAELTVIHHFRDRVPPPVPLAGGLTVAMITLARFIQRYVERPATRRLRGSTGSRIGRGGGRLGPVVKVPPSPGGRPRGVWCVLSVRRAQDLVLDVLGLAPGAARARARRRGAGGTLTTGPSVRRRRGRTP
ncbi:acyltransferase family protein [Streptomyces sp. NPDC058157]|uniref:acyltransferase family protein n=1 Tax=Streptomyces sp. NPDC058157 TaxID=3346360 RepID=UPI0036E1CFEB